MAAPASSPVKIAVNEAALIEAALFGPPNYLESLQRELQNTKRRLRVRVGKAEPFTGRPRGGGSRPNLHDVMRWLKALDKTSAYAEDLVLFRRLCKTVDTRLGTGAVGTEEALA
jgi:hypothetical protein